MGNNASNVSFGKPKTGGAIFNAPLGTPLPANASSELTSAYACMGHATDDGLGNNNSASVEKIRAWGGYIVLVAEGEKDDTWKVSLMEILNLDVLKAVYGAENVSGTLETGITIRANSKPKVASVWVFDMSLTNGCMMRVVLPNAVIGEIAEIPYKDKEAIKYAITLYALPGEDGDTHKEYILKPTGATGATSGN